MLSLLFKCVLEGAGWSYSTAGVYAINELLCFSDVDCMLFDVHVIHDEGWLYNVFKDTWNEPFEEEEDCLSIAYGVADLPR